MVGFRDCWILHCACACKACVVGRDYETLYRESLTREQRSLSELSFLKERLLQKDALLERQEIVLQKQREQLKDKDAQLQLLQQKLKEADERVPRPDSKTVIQATQEKGLQETRATIRRLCR